jgi:hypothetical protein
LLRSILHGGIGRLFDEAPPEYVLVLVCAQIYRLQTMYIEGSSGILVELHHDIYGFW